MGGSPRTPTLLQNLRKGAWLPGRTGGQCGTLKSCLKSLAILATSSAYWLWGSMRFAKISTLLFLGAVAVLVGRGRSCVWAPSVVLVLSMRE